MGLEMHKLHKVEESTSEKLLLEAQKSGLKNLTLLKSLDSLQQVSRFALNALSESLQRMLTRTTPETRGVHNFSPTTSPTKKQNHLKRCFAVE
jgi:hypothetical protein